MFWGRETGQDSKAAEEQQQQQQQPSSSPAAAAAQQRVHQLWCGKKLGNSSRFVRVILAQVAVGGGAVAVVWRG